VISQFLFSEQLQNILNRTNKNDYILLSGDLNSRIGNAEIHNIVGNFGEQVTNTNKLKLRDFATYNYMNIMNSFYKYKKIHKHKWSSHNSKTVTDYLIANRELSELFLDVRVYRGSDVCSDHFFTLAKLTFLPKRLHLPKNTACKENILHYKLRLLSDESM
jgi:endonuclease/exonuclease/phosphatase family metal-dependent hydrolase